MRLGILAGLFLCAAFSVSAAESPDANPIGFVRTAGDVTLDGSQMRANATVFNGSVIETSIWPSHVVLQDGIRVDLGRNSRTRVFREHVVLEKGITQVAGNLRFALIANSLYVASSQPFRVTVLDSKRVDVTAIDGSTEVKNAEGNLIASVNAGSTLDFQDTGTKTSNLNGCLQKVGTHYIVRDTTTGVVFQVEGENLDQYLGKPVQLTGSLNGTVTPIQGASEVVQASNVALGVGKGCKPEIASVPQRPTAGLPTSSAGLSVAARTAIIAGVVVGAGAISYGIYSGLNSGGPAPSPSSAP